MYLYKDMQETNTLTDPVEDNREEQEEVPSNTYYPLNGFKILEES